MTSNLKSRQSTIDALNGAYALLSRLLIKLALPSNWTRGAWARDSRGNPTGIVNSVSATAWCLTGGLLAIWKDGFLLRNMPDYASLDVARFALRMAIAEHEKDSDIVPDALTQVLAVAQWKEHYDRDAFEVFMQAYNDNRAEHADILTVITRAATLTWNAKAEFTGTN